jgi:hypothetical protein
VTTPNPGIVAAYERALLKAGVQIVVKRITGFAPNPTATFSAWVVAIVRDYQTDTTQPAQEGYAATKIGAIGEGDRMIILMATDLETARFPLPLRKNDRIVIVDTGDELNIVDVDAYKRAAAGAIELKAASVQ